MFLFQNLKLNIERNRIRCKNILFGLLIEALKNRKFDFELEILECKKFENPTIKTTQNELNLKKFRVGDFLGKQTFINFSLHKNTLILRSGVLRHRPLSCGFFCRKAEREENSRKITIAITECVLCLWVQSDWVETSQHIRGHCSYHHN